MKKYNKYIKSAIMAFLLFSSCNEEVLEKSNPNELSTDTFFETQAQLQSSVNAVYAGLQYLDLYGREYFFLHDMLSDENSPTGGLEAPRRAALTHNIDPGNKLVVDVWRGLYRIIHRANVVIANAADVPESAITNETRNRLEAEARFLRGWAYFELVSMWGDVPLITEPASSIEGNPRAPEEEIYTQIFEDLDFAEQHLDVRSSYSTEDLGRATEGAAQALKGKVHLFRANYSEARDELQKVIDSGEYRLVDRYLDNFEEENENNAESIFEVQFSTAFGYGSPWDGGAPGVIDEVTFRGQEYTPQTGWRNVNPTTDLKASFEEGDPRFGYNFYQDGDTYNNGESVMELQEPGWRKYSNAYKQGDEAQISGINFRVIRYADVLLMMAEAENELGNIAAAADYVNQVRARADVDMPPISTPASQEAMFDIIQNERRVEFPSEQIRNRDIRRWRRQGKLDSEPIANYQPRHDLLPIPTPEMDNNPALSGADQNPGY